MPRPSPYSVEQRSKILQVAIAAKARGKWRDALEAAKGEGFKGGLPYLMQMVRGTGKTSKKRGRGRPKGSKNNAATMNGSTKRRPRKTNGANTGAGLGEINQIVSRIVEQKTREVLQGALSALKQATRAIEQAL